MTKAVIWGLIAGFYLRFGLEPTGWLFYEASHSLGIEALYWGYSVFRGAGYAFSLWPYQAIACLLAGLLVGGLVWWRSTKGVAQ
ncbi:MAG: hypothetical protein P8L39_06415 [Halioglobus sp.]|nr:hypothetical protein [Halioglobus sp.]